MGTAAREVIHAYEPIADLHDRHPGWTLIRRPLGMVAEMYNWPRKIAILDLLRWEIDRPLLVAHMVAHLDLGHIGGCVPLTRLECELAMDLARINLDRQFEREMLHTLG